MHDTKPDTKQDTQSVESIRGLDTCHLIKQN
jgi:hypothetical protein